MIFYLILAGVLIVGGTIAFFEFRNGEIGFAFAGLFLTLLVGALILGLALLAAMFAAWKLDYPGRTAETRTHTADLRAVNTGSTVTGRFFLGSGQIDGKRTFSYVYKEGDWTRVGQVDAAESRVAENATPETAHMVTTTTDYSIWWIAPWVLWTDINHDFHVPADSVIESYEIGAE